MASYQGDKVCFPRVEYPSYDDAEIAVSIQEKQGKQCESYKCPHCGRWHIITGDPNKKQMANA